MSQDEINKRIEADIEKVKQRQFEDDFNYDLPYWRELSKKARAQEAKDMREKARSEAPQPAKQPTSSGILGGVRNYLGNIPQPDMGSGSGFGIQPPQFNAPIFQQPEPQPRKKGKKGKKKSQTSSSNPWSHNPWAHNPWG
jgi:hypothetical protein